MSSRAVVLGGSRGIGRASAEALAAEGHEVLVVGRDGDALADVIETIQRSGGRAEAMIGDLREAEDMARIAGAAGTIDAIFCNAGVLLGFGPVQQAPLDRLDATVRGNLIGPYQALQALLPNVSQGGAVVINAAGAALRPRAGLADYAASKAALIAFGRALAQEVARCGIRVNMIAPGFIATDSWKAALGGQAETLAATVPLGRIGDPADVAKVVTWLLSDGARYVAGAVIPVDGGLAAL